MKHIWLVATLAACSASVVQPAPRNARERADGNALPATLTSLLGHPGPALVDGATPSRLGWGADDRPYPDRFSVHPGDLGEYVWVPAGSFTMGADDQANNGNPARRIRIAGGYWLGKHEVTVAQFRRFCEALGRKVPPEDRRELAHPVLGIVLTVAKAYCAR